MFVLIQEPFLCNLGKNSKTLLLDGVKEIEKNF